MTYTFQVLAVGLFIACMIGVGFIIGWIAVMYSLLQEKHNLNYTIEDFKHDSKREEEKRREYVKRKWRDKK